MRSPDGQIARLGDSVRVAGVNGRIVCSIDTGDHSDDYPEQDRADPQRGIMVEWTGAAE
ncbi:hypothetical protein [Bradyrhizobium sp. SZCCHNS3051]|uniref:hypothetical protein n=1 Tax=Bradyrhizobium sp. SZCCHNS3051 TaxID=3057320 RepID=UPI002916BDA9|nr:hypothetical protein [Bradyrhizobium sp. SZCCHNS3051]